jgi:hypothetical protein
MLAGVFARPHLAIEHAQAHDLASALANVQEFYPTVRLLSDKHMALFGLGVVATRVYGPMLLIEVGAMPAPKPDAPKAEPEAQQTAPIKLRPNGADHAPDLTASEPWGLVGAPIPDA